MPLHCFWCLDSNLDLNSNLFVCFRRKQKKRKKEEDNRRPNPLLQPSSPPSSLALSPVHEVRSRPLAFSCQLLRPSPLPRPSQIPAQQSPTRAPPSQRLTGGPRPSSPTSGSTASVPSPTPARGRVPCCATLARTPRRLLGLFKGRRLVSRRSQALKP
jgi:hypothetical protein